MKHNHADLMAAYAADAQTTFTPWELWQCRVPRSVDPKWFALVGHPMWATDCEYRRKPVQHTIVQHTIVLNTEQLKEIILACECPSWENGDFVTGVAVLKAALGTPTKTNAQIVCEKLRKAYDDLEKHSAEIVEPNVDHIQKLVWDAMQLLVKGDVK